MSRAPWVIAWLGAALPFELGCGEEAPAAREYHDIGSFCLVPGEAGTAVLAVSFGDSGEPCLSWCGVHVGSCSAALVDGRVQVQSTLTTTQGTGDACPDACATASASCELPLPDPGDYLFVLGGGRSTAAALPPVVAVPLFGERACHP